MYAGTELMFPYFQNFPQEVQQFEDFGCSFKLNASSGVGSNVIQACGVSDYNLWGEGDLFNAPAPVIEEEASPVIGLDPMTAISMISCGEDVISSQSLNVSDIESSMESGQLMSEVFYECRRDIMAKEGNETPLSEVLSINIPADENDYLPAEGVIQKSVSSSCLRSMDEGALRPSFLDFPGVMELETVYGMRRAYSEGDMKTLDAGYINNPLQSPMAQSRAINRREQLSRYWSKKSKRNFGRKIKYACRKALADSQPRIRGRFAKTEETETVKKQL